LNQRGLANVETEGRQVIENQDTVKPTHPWWVDLSLVVAGVGCDWYFAFKWFSGKFSYWSGPALRGMVLTGMVCALIAIVVGRAKWREGVQIFFALSYGLFGYMMIDRGGGWPGQPR
jgi:hypothetical protein